MAREHRRRQEHLRQLAETDAMTHIRNRFSGEARVRAMIAEGVGGMFMLMDVDQFKTINDQYGHAVGDEVLVAVAAALRSTLRENDTVFRLGGDEFSAFAPGVPSEAVVRRIADTLLQKVSAIQIEGLRGRPVRISVGVTFFAPNQGDTFEMLYHRADKNMYYSKQHGGHQATIA